MANEFRIKNGLITPAVLSEETDGKIVLTRLDADTGDGKGVILAFETKEENIELNDVLGKITFAAPDEETGTNALLVGAAIQAISEGDFAADNNATKMVFQTAANGTAATKMTISSTGVIDTTGNLNVGGELDVVGATTLDGAVTLGNATGDDITFTGRLASDIIPKTDLAYDLGSATLGFNTLHIGAAGIINFEAGDISLTHSSNTLTMTGGTFVSAVKTVSPIYNNTLESGSAGAGFRVTNTATMSLEEKTALSKTNSINTHWTGLSLENSNVTLNATVTDTGTIAAEEIIPLVYIDLDDTDQIKYHSVTAHCSIQSKVTPTGGGTDNAIYFSQHETIKATYKATQNRVEFQSMDCNWYAGNYASTRNNQPGEFCAMMYTVNARDDANDQRYLVIGWCQYLAVVSGRTTTVTAMIDAHQMPVAASG